MGIIQSWAGYRARFFPGWGVLLAMLGAACPAHSDVAVASSPAPADDAPAVTIPPCHPIEGTDPAPCAGPSPAGDVPLHLVRQVCITEMYALDVMTIRLDDQETAADDLGGSSTLWISPGEHRLVVDAALRATNPRPIFPYLRGYRLGMSGHASFTAATGEELTATIEVVEPVVAPTSTLDIRPYVRVTVEPFGCPEAGSR